MEYTTLAGTSIGKGRNELVVADNDFSNHKTVRITGRYVYGKKTVRQEKNDMLILAEKTRNDNAFVLILAIGDKCRNAGVQVNPNDIIGCPDDAPEGIMRSPYCSDDYFIHEDLLQMQIGR